jgi:hypothetical protein
VPGLKYSNDRCTWKENRWLTTGGQYESRGIQSVRCSRGEPPDGLSAPLVALWWDARQGWTRAHALVVELETHEGMAVHAYLHRKGGQASNADYWYHVLVADFIGPRLMKNGGRR